MPVREYSGANVANAVALRDPVRGMFDSGASHVAGGNLGSASRPVVSAGGLLLAGLYWRYALPESLKERAYGMLRRRRELSGKRVAMVIEAANR